MRGYQESETRREDYSASSVARSYPPPFHYQTPHDRLPQGVYMGTEDSCPQACELLKSLYTLVNEKDSKDQPTIPASHNLYDTALQATDIIHSAVAAILAPRECPSIQQRGVAIRATMGGIFTQAQLNHHLPVAPSSSNPQGSPQGPGYRSNNNNKYFKRRPQNQQKKNNNWKRRATTQPAQASALD